MTFISYAQNFEDVLLWRALKDVRHGFYIDVGAQHPDTDSVTRAFYDRLWSGINVEPAPAAARRLREARPRDITLQLALAAQPGQAPFYVVDGTGLSTLDKAALGNVRAGGFIVDDVQVAVETLATICRRHVHGPIHFLKIDVEGSEAAVLAGADFARFRPWIVLIEAIAPLTGEPSHAAWEDGLLGAGYRFAWYDGLNRFYVAEEHADALLPAFAVPPNVGDDFLRVADTEWARRVAESEGRAETLRERLAESERRRRAADDASARAHLLLARESALRATAEAEAQLGRQTAYTAHVATYEAAQLRGALQREREEAEQARTWLAAIQGSSSWRLTAPLRRAGSLAARLRGENNGAPPAPDADRREPCTLAPPSAIAAGPHPAQRRPALLRTVHQFHSGSATGDAVTEGMRMTRRLLREMGYRSEIFVQHRDPALADELRLVDELPRHADYVLIVHHSIGHHALDFILALPAPKILYYHNITPPEHLPEAVRPFAVFGRQQLAQLRPHVHAALANSAYSAVELRHAGFDPVSVCPLLFDIADLSGCPPRSRAPGEPFTVLFVGRVIESKGQRDLIEAFADFNRELALPARLVLVGRHGGPDEPYCASILEAIRRNQLDGQVVITGALSDAERDGWYDRADLYVSLSRHEGFGVPLVEAMARGVPILAWPAGAVASTVGDGAELLESPLPSLVAGHMLRLARDPARLADLAARGRREVARYDLDRQLPKLVEALARAGGAPPADPAARTSLARSLQFTVTGPVNGNYSLSLVNTTLAATLESAWPGRVRVLPVETTPISDIDHVPPDSRAVITALAGRPPVATGPEIVISQHYPVYAPPLPGDLPLSLFFWEESLVPEPFVTTLNRAFRGVLAPSRFVAKALVDSGVHVPVRVLPQAPALGPFEALGREREARQPGPVFTFLHVSSCFPRKGVDALLAAYARAFRASDSVRLMIKGYPNIHNDVPEQLAALDAQDPRHAPVEVINRDLPLADMLDLYRAADAIVLPARGEGYNLPAAEAMAAGIPLILTGFGGHRDFCGPDEARLVGWRFAVSSSHLATPGSVWAEPDVEDLAAALREAVHDPAAAAARACRAKARITGPTRPQPMTAALEAIALDLLLAPPAEPLRVAWVSSWDVRCGVAEYSRHLLDCLPRDGLAELVILSDTRTAPGGPARPVWRSYDPSSMPLLAQAVAETDPHVVAIQHQPGLLPWPGLAALLGDAAMRGRATIVTLHNTAHLLDIAEGERRSVLSTLGGCSRVLVHTLADLNRLAAVGLIDNVSLLPHGTRAPLPQQKARHLAEADPALIGSYGFFLPDKGLPELIRSLAVLRRTRPATRLRLVNAEYGAAGSRDEIARCRELAAELGLADAVEFHTEFLPEQRSLELLSGCDAVALPYQASKEGSSAAMRSALAAGVPVAVTPLPLFDEAGAAVTHLPGSDPGSIAAGIAALLDDPAARDALTETARHWLAERSWTVIAPRLAGMMRGLAAQSS